MTDPTKPGPRALPVVYTCTGCPALHIERWGGVRAHAYCQAAPYPNGRHITPDWQTDDPSPDWCPHGEEDGRG